MKYNNNSTIMVISIVILVIAVIVLVVYLIKSKDKLELNLGGKKDNKAKLWILNNPWDYTNVRVTVREGDAILYSAPIAPTRMTPPISAVFEGGGNSTVFHTNININGTIYPKSFTVLKGHNYKINIDKHYSKDSPISDGPKIVVTQTNPSGGSTIL